MIVETILTSGIISTAAGIIIKLLFDLKLKRVEQRFARENKELEIQLNALSQRKRYDYELVIDSLKLIWGQFTQIENHLILGINHNWQYDPQWSFIRTSVHDIRNSMLFLPEGLYQDVNSFITNVFNNELNRFQANFAKEIESYGLAGKLVRQEDHPELFEKLNVYILELQNAWWKQRDELRQQIREHVEGIQ